MQPRLVLALAVAFATVASAQDSQGLTPVRPAPGLHVGGFVNGNAQQASVSPDRIVVRFTQLVDGDALRTAIAKVGLELVDRGIDGTFEVFRCDPSLTDAWIQWLGQQEGVAFAERDPIAHTMVAPNDPYYSLYQWNFYNAGTLSNGRASNYGIRAEGAWDTPLPGQPGTKTTGAGVKVAVVDTGVAYETFGGFTPAPDLVGVPFVTPYDAVTGDGHANDENGHGTHVTGTIAQRTNNGVGCAGVAYGCTIMPVRVLDAAGSGQLTWIANGITHATNNGANVITMSLGGSTGSTALQNAIVLAAGVGITITAATGNTGRQGVSFPAAYTQCIAVGSTRFDGTKPRYGTFGTGIDVSAPGGDTSVDQNGDGFGDGILQNTFGSSTTPNTFGYYFFQGTSMATPHVAAVAALVRQAHPNYTAAQVRSAIESSCTDRGSAGYDTTYGFGIVNAALAITR